MTRERVTLDRAVVERLLSTYLHSEDCEEGIYPDGPLPCNCWQAALRDALRGAEPEDDERRYWDNHTSDGRCKYPATCDRWPAETGHPTGPMPEPPLGLVVVTIDGRDVWFRHNRIPASTAPWGSSELVNNRYSHTWQQVLEARDPGTKVRRG